MRHRCFKYLFGLSLVISCTSVVYWMFNFQQKVPLILPPSDTQNLKMIHFQSDENQEFPELWRHTKQMSGSILSDRIDDQLEWTKKLFSDGYISEDTSAKNILLVFGLKGWQFWQTNNRINCPNEFPEPKCKLSSSFNLGEANLNLSNFDAMIYAHDYDGRNAILTEIPGNVKQIYYLLEPPRKSSLSFYKYSIVSSYYRGSDIVIPYSKWVSFDNDKLDYFYDGNRPQNKIVRNFIAGKTKFAVAVISNCNTNNNRWRYIYELQKYISIDIFGRCGTALPCEISKSTKCLRNIVSEYKFYLSFENSNCRDYITEKLFTNALKNDILPVVMGAHPDDYVYAAPPKSYIHVEDFHSPEHLAKYLIIVSNNESLYNEYFQWQGTGFFYNSLKDIFCRLCGMLFYNDYKRSPEWRTDADWETLNKCLPDGQWYWNRNVKYYLPADFYTYLNPFKYF